MVVKANKNHSDKHVLVIQNQVLDAFESGRPLKISGGNTKAWYGRQTEGDALSLAEHTGIINYQPTELTIKVKAGTKLTDIARALDEHGQRLPFDPPYFGDEATIGGTVACNFSGPRRPYAGSARDFVLGCTIVNGQGEILSFGGEVMKNVAGFDVSRLMAGSLGGLGVLLDVSLKVLPHRLAEQTVVIESSAEDSIQLMNRWACTPLPITAMCADSRQVYFRLCGTASSVLRSQRDIGGTIFEDGFHFWKDLREHQSAYFESDEPLYRLSVPPAAKFEPMLGSAIEDWFLGWGGAQRWLKSDLPFSQVQAMAKKMGGSASLFRGGDRNGEVFAPLPAPLFALHQTLKSKFDPKCILNPGRMYKGL
jgi:glycolate oxidase FAD binding subunit